MESGGSIYLVVAGGEECSEDTTSYLDSVEILDLNSPDEGWKTGNQRKLACHTITIHEGINTSIG